VVSANAWNARVKASAAKAASRTNFTFLVVASFMIVLSIDCSLLVSRNKGRLVPVTSENHLRVASSHCCAELIQNQVLIGSVQATDKYALHDAAPVDEN
jgi:hypothetical protein